MQIRALIVDDEPLAREKIRTLLAGDPEIEVVRECAGGRDAVNAIREHTPDLLFLDIQMPELDGFGVLQQIGRERIPVIIFVTAYDEYALKAFEVHALDYLLKPFDRDRFETALGRAKKRVRSQRTDDLNERVVSLLTQLQERSGGDWLERLVVKTSGRIYFVSVDEIDWIEAAGNYVELHVGSRSHLVRVTMKGLEERLDPREFVRVHRSAIVNIRRIREMQPWFSGEYLLVLEGGAKVTTGQSYRPALRTLLGNPE